MEPAQPANQQRLTIRQQEVLDLLCKGMRNGEIGYLLRLSERTVKGYVSQLFLIFDVTNRTELVARVLERSDN
jgi:DNA-binding NarL/FixJ family response regulator